MSRRKKDSIKVGIRTPEFARQAVMTSCEELRVLNELYDSQHYLVSRTLATIIYRLLDDEIRLLGATRRAELFSMIPGVSEDNLLLEIPHVTFELSRSLGIERVKCLDVSHGPNSQLRRELSVNDWLDETIMLEGLGSFESRQQKALPKDVGKIKRYRITRRNLLKRIRDEMGAHFDRRVTAEWDFVTSWGGFITISANIGGREVNHIENPELFSFDNNFADALIRSLSEEVLRSLENFLELEEARVGYVSHSFRQ